MAYLRNKTVLFNCKIVTENDILKNHVIILSDNIIENIIKDSSIMPSNANFIDCNENYILPGLIDLHSDVIEKIIVPRKSVVFDNMIALNEIDRELMLQGITTIYHSISIAESTICNNNRTLKLNNMFDLCELIYKQNKNLTINHKFHARLELNSINAFDYVYSAICEGKINELSFMDHTPGQGQYKNLEIFKKVIHQQYGHVSDKQQNEIINTCISKPKIDIEKLEILIKKAFEANIPMAYHDVDSYELIDWMLNKHITISEFPLNAEVAKYASDKGMYSIVGAPNILLGQSHYNNATASTLILENGANIICSDYFSPSLLLAIFKLTKDFKIPLPEAVKLATLTPAKAVNISDKYGSIEIGKNADLIVVDIKDEIPKVSKVIINGIIKLEIATGRKKQNDYNRF